MFPLLNCCVAAAVPRLGKFLASLVPGGGALIEVVEFGADVWERWKKQKPAEAARREELQALAHASAERVEAAVQAAIQAEAAGQPAAVKRKLTTYLIQVQVTVRRTLCRPADPEGRTVLADLRLNSAKDLRPFLPPQLPRFEPGELNSPPARSPRDFDREGGGGVRRPPRRGVPGWVWLAGSVAAVVVVVVVVLVVRNGSRPKTPDGPPVAVKAPSDADKRKDADKTKDAEPDRKKDKRDKTDTPEKPAPLPRLAAFPKLSLPERGAADLQVKVERQGYAGPIKLQVENLPPGVTCQRSATIPARESALRLEFRTDGTAAEGTATVEVIALADARTADRQTLSLVVPPKTVVPSAKMFPGLLAYWPFDEGEGDSPADVSGSVRGKGHNIEWVDGVRGKAIRVKGKGSHFDFSAHPKLSFAAGADFTFCGWVRTRQKDGVVLSNRADADGTPTIDLHLNSGVLGLGVRQQGATDYISLKGAKVVSDGEWRHFAFTRQGADLALYTDGALEQRLDNTRAGGAIPTDLRALGAELYWQKVDPGPEKVPDVAYFAGDFDEFCVFGRALSAAEIRTLAGKKVPD